MNDRIPADAPLEHGSRHAPLQPGTDRWTRLRKRVEENKAACVETMNRMVDDGRAEEATQPSPYAMADAFGGVLAMMDALEKETRS